MKKLIVAFALMASGAAMAQVPASGLESKPAPSFAEYKAKLLSHITDAKTCVESAQNREDLEKCRPRHHAERSDGFREHGPGVRGKRAPCLRGEGASAGTGPTERVPAPPHCGGHHDD